MNKDRNQNVSSTISVVGAAIVQNGQCLVALRAPDMAEPNRWEFPGGKVEPGESPESALIREIQEELGVTVSVGPRLGQGVVSRPQLTIQLDVYRAQLVAGEPRAREHAQLRWISADEVNQLHWADADVPVLPHLIEELRKD